jgi:hypothetical protein
MSREPFTDQQIETAFWAKVNKNGPIYTDGLHCWLWTASKRGQMEYGCFRVHAKALPAHRWLYERVVGLIPEGFVCDHLCRRPLCVRPEHIEIVTNRENILRGAGASARHARTTHCPSGHPYINSNTYHWQGHRKCKTCAIIGHLRRYVNA